MLLSNFVRSKNTIFLESLVATPIIIQFLELIGIKKLINSNFSTKIGVILASPMPYSLPILCKISFKKVSMSN